MGDNGFENENRKKPQQADRDQKQPVWREGIKGKMEMVDRCCCRRVV
jgi:hypothetical protein